MKKTKQKNKNKTKKANSALGHLRTYFRNIMSERHLNSFMTDVFIIKKPDWFLCDRDLRHEGVNTLLLACIHGDIYSLIMRQNN